MYCHQCGYEIKEESMFCPNCGTSLKTDQSQYQANSQPNNYYKKEDDESSLGFAILSFFIPVVGIVLYCVWNKEYPKKAKSCLKGFVSSIVIYIVIVCCMISTFIGVAGGLSERDYHDGFNYDYFDEDFNFDSSNTIIQPLI